MQELITDVRDERSIFCEHPPLLSTHLLACLALNALPLCCWNHRRKEEKSVSNNLFSSWHEALLNTLLQALHYDHGRAFPQSATRGQVVS
jgi:hypothetical protein